MREFVISLDRFRINNTRSPSQDTDVVTFTAKVGDLLYPVQVKRMGDVTNADHSVGLEIGPIIATPHAPVSFGYAIVNSGYDSSNENATRQALNKLSDAAAAICTGIFGGGNVWDQLNKDTQWLNGLIFGHCDGPVAGDGIFVAVDILDSWTVNGGHSETRSYPGSPSNVGCGSNSQYTVTWSVTRVKYG